VPVKAAETTDAAHVFVPSIGFRRGTTRTLVERAETTEDGTRLIVLAVAAAPDKTEMLIEWERTGDPATCAPGSQLLVYSNMAPLEKGLSAVLVAGGVPLNAMTMAQRGFQVSHQTIGAIHTVTFPSLPDTVDGAELVISENGHDWRVPLVFRPGRVVAAPLATRVKRDGVIIRATALARDEGELIVHLEVEAPRQVRQVGAPLPSGPSFSTYSKELRSGRRAEMRRVLGDRARPITLEDGLGARHEEVRRMFDLQGQHAGSAQPFINHFAVVFEAPNAAGRSATLVVPFVDVSDFDGSVTADLRQVPVDLEIGPHHFHVQSGELIVTDRRRVIVEGKPSPWPPRFRHPAVMHGADPKESSWPNAGPGEQVVFDAAVGDPPIVTFKGAVFRIDGPLRLEIPLV